VLRSKLIGAGNGLVQDAVITGHDRDYLGAIIFPELNFARELAGLPESAPLSAVVQNPKVKAHLQDTLNALGATSTGSSTCIRRAILADFELSIDKGEVTDKGSINQRNILRNRAEVVAQLYQSEIADDIISYQKKVQA